MYLIWLLSRRFLDSSFINPAYNKNIDKSFFLLILDTNFGIVINSLILSNGTGVTIIFEVYIIRCLCKIYGELNIINPYKIKNEYKLDSFVSIDNSVVNVVVAKKDHDVNLANDIMKTVQKEFENKMYITVKFAN